MPLLTMILALARKTVLPKLQWVLLSGLVLSELGMVTVAFQYFGLWEKDPLKNCFYTQRLIWGMSDIIIYTISLIMGFRIYVLSNELHFFAIEGCLPCEKTKKRNNTILRAIAIIAFVDWVAYVFLNTFWTFVDRDVHAMRLFNSLN